MLRFLFLSAAATLALVSQTAQAQNGTWTSATDGNWSDGGNWSGGTVADGADNTATFSSSANVNVTLDTPRTIGNLTFNTSSYNLIGGSTLALQNSAGNPTITVNAGTTMLGLPLSSSQQISFTGGSGGGQLMLTNQNNSLPGGIIYGSGNLGFTPGSLGTGTIIIGQNPGDGQMGFDALGTDPTGNTPVVVSNNVEIRTVRCIYDWQGMGSLTSQQIIFKGNIYLNMGSGNVRDQFLFHSVYFDGVLSGGGTYGLNLVNGNLHLENSGNTFSGNVNLTGGSTLWVNSDGALGTGLNSINFNAAGATLKIEAPFATQRSFNMANTGTINVQTNTLEIQQSFNPDTITGVGGLTVTGTTGELILDGANGFQGPLTINGGTLFSASGSSLSSVSPATVASNAAWVCDSVSFPGLPKITIEGDGLLVFSNSPPVLNDSLDIVDNGAMDVSAVSGGFSLTSGQTLEGTGSVAGSLSANNGSVISPGTTGTAGTLSVGGDLALDGQTIQFDLSSNVVEGGGTNDEIVVGGTLTLNSDVKLLLNYVNGSLAAGTYKIIKYGALTGSGTISLVTSYPNVSVDSSGTPGYITLVVSTPSVANNLFWKGDGTANVWDINTTANWVTNFNDPALFYNDPSKVTFDDRGSNNVPVTLNTVVRPASVTFNLTNHSYTLTGSGSISGTASLTINGGQTVSNNLASDYSGGTFINGGSTLVLGDGATPGSGDIAIAANTSGRVVVDGATPITLPNIAGNGGSPQVVQNSSAVTTLGGGGDNASLGATVNNGTLLLAKSSGGGVNALSGSITVNTNGTLMMGGSGGDQIADSAIVTMNGGSYDMAGLKETFNQLTGYGTIRNSVGGGWLTLPGTSLPTSLTAKGGTMTLKHGVLYTGFWASAVGGAGFQNTGGTLNAGGYFIIGDNGGSGTAVGNFISGTTGVPLEFILSFGSPSDFTIESNAVMNVNFFSYGEHNTTMHFDGGTITLNRFNLRGPATNIAYFNGTTFIPQDVPPIPVFNGNGPATLAEAYVSTNGIIWDANSFSNTWTENFTHDPALGSTPDGGLTLNGPGALVLPGNNTFTGPVSNLLGGKLVINNVGGPYSAMYLDDGATNQINMIEAGTGQSLTNGTLIMGSSGYGTMDLIFNLGTLGVPTAPILDVLNAVTNAGNVDVSIASVVPFAVPATVPLVHYGSMDPASFATWSLDPIPYATASLTNDTANDLISAVIVPVPSTNLPNWEGVNGTAWDASTPNWTTNNGATTIAYPFGAPAIFNDSASSHTVDISSGNVSPAFIIVSNAVDYLFSGSSGITGTGSLIKEGPGSLVLSNADSQNTYSGATYVTGGAIVAAAPNVLSSADMTFNDSALDVRSNSQNIGNVTFNNSTLLGDATLTGNGGALTFNNDKDFTMGAMLAGNIVLTMEGTGEMTLTNSSVSVGNTLIKSGTIRVKNALALGPGAFGSGEGAVSMLAGGRLILDGSLTISNDIGFAGTGPDGMGCFVVTNGDAVDLLPCYAGYDATLYVSAGSSMLFEGGAAKIFGPGVVTKSGPGSLLTGTGTGFGTAGLIIDQGSVIISNVPISGFTAIHSGGTLAGSGNGQGVVTIAAGGTLTPDQNNALGTFTASAGLTNAGSIDLQILKTDGATNADQIICTAGFVNDGGALTVTTNAGTTLPLATGDTFKLFSLTNYAALSGLAPTLPALPSGLHWTNNLATDGTIAVVGGVSTEPFSIGASISGNQLILTWPASHTGWRLEVQTNSLSVGISTNWVTVSGSTQVHSVTNTIDPANGTVFYRMVYP